MIDSQFVHKHNLQRTAIQPRNLSGFDGKGGGETTEVAVVRTDVNGHSQDRVYLYIVPRIQGYDMIMGKAWIKDQNVWINPNGKSLTIGPGNLLVSNLSYNTEREIDCLQVSAAGFTTLARKRKKTPGTQVFAASMADVEKALQTKQPTDPRTRLPQHYHEFLPVFDCKEADKLPSHRGNETDHRIQLEQVNGKEAEIPWGPLYSMSREELLVLRKTLTELLDKQFIRVSNSPAAAPVLFVRKPGGGLRFCVDYRALNKITRKDRYPLPLIQETLRNIGKAKWFTKLDVTAAFYKIRIAEGDEWKTAFRTRYGLFEWLVTPFGLANAPSTFQRYINWSLRDYLDEFCSAYVDDVLIYSDGTLEQHRNHVRQVLARLQEAGLQLDIDKCEFEVQSTKYLGFIIQAGQGISMDPAKVKAIREWEAPKNVKGVQSFLGFANFYRQFIKDYSSIAQPISSLVRKDTKFDWTDGAETAFVRLKEAFVTAPLLVQFDSERETIVETDASTWCIGGTLMQYDEDGVLRPCAFYSKKNAPAECNYEIYDKEMLAIVRCLEEWDAELRSVQGFQIRTDHKNLEYFMTTRKLTERQVRWSLILSRYNFTISYVPGPQNPRADALSRREQDMPNGETDDRVKYRTMQLLKPEMVPGTIVGSVFAAPVQDTDGGAGPNKGQDFGPQLETELEQLWREAKEQDHAYQQMVESVQEERRVFPRELNIRVSISECSLSDKGELLFRGRKWVPDLEALRTRLIQAMHDSVVTGHPGKGSTSLLMARQYFWPRMMGEIRRFVRNCDTCGSNKAWRERRQGFLKPLPIPDRIWQEISMDFITDLPLSSGCTNLMVITDRLGKGVIFEALPNIEAETVARVFVQCYYRHHFVPRAIVSDRGTQFVGILWARVCQLLKIQRRLSTAYHPETDGATERMNQTLEAYLRTFVDFDQDNWVELLPFAELAINNRDAASTGVSPFFLSHGYNVELTQVSYDDLSTREGESPVQKADRIIGQLKRATEWAQSAMAVAQQVQEDSKNRTRQQATNFRVGDKVWLDLRDVRTRRPSKKLDVKYAKYTITEVISSHAFRLNTPPGIHNVFHSSKLKLASTDPLPSQQRTDAQPEPQIIGDQAEYEVEKILGERVVQRGRGQKTEYLVKWVGYREPTWEPVNALQDVAALDSYEAGERNVVTTNRRRRGRPGEKGGNVMG